MDNDLDRRALLGAAGLLGVAAIASSRASAGPLNPPGGAVGSTGRTLDDIYNHIPAIPALGSYDGRIPVTSAGSILNPGSYVLTNNLDMTGNFTTLFISANNVTLDLNGFRISNSGTGPCLALLGAISNITIRNGMTANGYYGILGDSNGTFKGLLIENIRVLNPRYNGINIPSTTSRGVTIRRCEVVDCGVTTTAADVSIPVIGIGYSGNLGRISDCSVQNIANAGSGAITTRGIYIGPGANANLIENCHVVNAATVTGNGVAAPNPSNVYRNCMIVGYSAAIGGGRDGGGNTII